MSIRKENTLFFVGLIAISTIISWILAVTVDLNKYELGAMFNMFFPPIVGVLSVVIFLLLNFIKGKKFQIANLIFCCLLNLYTGCIFHFELAWFPLN
jgi:hypothetical protein